jgi:hypothetical protein
VPKNCPTMDTKIEATQKMKKKCDTFLEAKKIISGGLARPQCNLAKTRASHANNINIPNILPLVVFFAYRGLQGYIVNNPRQQCPWILYTKRTSQCSHILLMNLQHSSKCPPSSTTLSFLQPCLSQSDIEYQYAFL